MPAAARLNDPTMHGGWIISGSADVFIGGMPAARMQDQHACPQVTGGVAHVGGMIVRTSNTVFINRLGAARQGDSCLCFAPGPPPTSAPTIVQLVEASAEDDDDSAWESPKIGFKRERKPWKRDEDELVLIKKEWVKRNGELYSLADGHVLIGAYKVEVKSEVSVDVKSLKVKLKPIEVNLSGSGVTFTSGKLQADRVSLEGKVQIANAAVKARGGIEIDGQKGEFTAGGKVEAEASLIRGEIGGEVCDDIAFTDWEVCVAPTASGTLVSIGAEGRAEVGFSKDKGFHAGVGGKVAFGVGAGASVDVYVREKRSLPIVGIPGVGVGMDTILLGDFTVIIG